MSRFRASRSTRSGRPGNQNDQDVFDGLPIRQWRFQPSAIAAPDDAAANGPALDAPVRGKGQWIEYSMPKGSEHYPSWCQQILREARLGRLVAASQGYSRSVFGRAVTREEEKENEYAGEVEDAPAGTKRSRTPAQAGFVANKWTQTARNLEDPEVEYLAKRRKGLRSVHGVGAPPVAVAPVSTSAVGVVAVAPGTVPVNSGTLKRIKVKRVDAQGHAKVWEVLIPEGHPIDGELTDATMSVEDAALPIERPVSGTVVESLGVAGDDGAVIASFSAIPTLSAHATQLPPRIRKKTKSGFRKGRSRKLGVGDRGGVSASAESLYATEVEAAGHAAAATAAVPMDVDDETPNAAVDGEDGSEEGEIDEDEGEEAEGDEEEPGEGEGEADGDADMLELLEDGEDEAGNEDGLGDEDREEGELTPDPAEASESLAQFIRAAPIPAAAPALEPALANKPKLSLQPPPASLPPRPPAPAAAAEPVHPGDATHTSQSLPSMPHTLSDGPEATALGATTVSLHGATTIEELATEPSVPVGVELADPAHAGIDGDQDMVVTPADTESSYAPPEPNLPDFLDRAELRVEVAAPAVDLPEPALPTETGTHPTAAVVNMDEVVPAKPMEPDAGNVPAEPDMAMDIDKSADVDMNFDIDMQMSHEAPDETAAPVTHIQEFPPTPPPAPEMQKQETTPALAAEAPSYESTILPDEFTAGASATSTAEKVIHTAEAAETAPDETADFTAEGQSCTATPVAPAEPLPAPVASLSPSNSTLEQDTAPAQAEAGDASHSEPSLSVAPAAVAWEQTQAQPQAETKAEAVAQAEDVFQNLTAEHPSDPQPQPQHADQEQAGEQQSIDGHALEGATGNAIMTEDAAARGEDVKEEDSHDDHGLDGDGGDGDMDLLGSLEKDLEGMSRDD